jgi:RimJ/RimL family protein N-acetyltransferase
MKTSLAAGSETPFNLTPLVLQGRVARLEPLDLQHSAGLLQVGKTPSIWEHMLYGQIDSLEKIQAFVQDLLQRQQRGTDLPFTVIHLPSGRIAGCTRYMDIQPHNRALEIGGTWYGLEFQRTALNTEAKFLLLEHAFEHLGAVRVQLKTDVNNLRSQRAIKRLGAVREGVLREHMLRPDGSRRSSVYYSILDHEWPIVRERLLGYLARPVA